MTKPFQTTTTSTTLPEIGVEYLTPAQVMAALPQASTKPLKHKLCPAAYSEHSDGTATETFDQLYQADLEDKAEQFYQWLIQDGWNCYRDPKLYPERLHGAAHKAFWVEVVRRFQVVTPGMLNLK